jgi:murein L,D-transpeptidase YafK
MKPLVILCSLCFGPLASCEEKQKISLTVIDHTLPPGPARAKAAAANTRPGLVRDLSAVGLKFGDPIFIRVFKDEALLEMFIQHRASGKYHLFRAYPIAAASGTLGPKLAEGDGQVPEGFYQVLPTAMNPASQYHLSFNIGYPNEYDRAHQRTGSAIMVHGNRVSIGCLAMTDEKIEEIYTLAAAAHQGGQPFFPIHIFPFRITSKHIETTPQFANKEFWMNLKQGYDLFEQTHIPPQVYVVRGRYLAK